MSFRILSVKIGLLVKNIITVDQSIISAFCVKSHDLKFVNLVVDSGSLANKYN